MKRFLSAVMLSLSLITTASSVVIAADFNDVPESYWAYKEITDIASRGYMTADTQGNFNPKNYIDKFDTSRILSLAAGYNGNDETSASYAENKSVVTQYENKFSKWDSDANEAIIYLLEKGILKTEDLAQFVITNTDSKEQLRALSREEYAVFLVRLMGKEAEAQAYTTDYTFTDDSLIAQSRKNSVYYLKGIGIVSGNTDGKYNPKGAVTKAEFCVLLSKTLEKMPSEQVVEKPAAEIKETSETIVGTVDQVFPSLNVVQIINNDKTSLYKVKQDAAITVNGYTSSFDSIKAGMAVSAIVDDYEISALNASGDVQEPVTAAEMPVEETTEQIQIPAPQTESVSAEPQTEPQTQAELSTVYAVIDSADTDKIKASVYSLSEYFAVEKEIFSAVPASNISVTRNGQTVAFTDITDNEPVKMTTDGEKVYSIELMGEVCIFNGTKIVKTYYNEDNDCTSIIIQTSEGGLYSFDTTDESIITRNGQSAEPTSIIAGDKAAVTVKGGKITAMAAIIAEPSVLSNMYVAQIHLSSDYLCLALSENEDLSEPELYSVSASSVNPYILKVGDKVRVGLEGTEISTIEIKDRKDENTYTGLVTDKKTSVITISCLSDISTAKSAKVSYDVNTVFYDSTTGKSIKYADIEENMLVYVTYEDDLDDDTVPTAKSITVLKRK